jgi:hypothetical protein
MKEEVRSVWWLLDGTIKCLRLIDDYHSKFLSGSGSVFSVWASDLLPT